MTTEPTSAASERDLRLRTIQGVKDLLRSSGSMYPERDAVYVESNGYSAWLSSLAKEQRSTAPISNEEILRRIEAREALRDAK